MVVFFLLLLSENQKKIVLVGSLPSTRAERGGGGVGVVWVWVSVLILLFSPDVWICRLFLVPLQPINIYLRSEIRENGKTAFFVSFADFSTILVQENFREGKQ